MATYMAKPETVERKWYVVDATDMVLGRLASQIATILRGKNKPIFTPHVDTGDYVVVLNCEKIVLTGKKLEQKSHFYHTGYVGGLKEIKYGKLMAEKPEFALELAVKGMLPKNAIGRKMIKKMHAYRGAEHEQQAQMPELIKLI